MGRQKVADLLAELGYSLQANQKTKEGSANHPDRDQQFNYINEQATAFQLEVNLSFRWTRKKRNWWASSRMEARNGSRKGEPEPVQGHDFPDPKLGKANPYGVYDQQPTSAG